MVRNVQCTMNIREHSQNTYTFKGEGGQRFTKGKRGSENPENLVTYFVNAPLGVVHIIRNALRGRGSAICYETF
jgi:hypothetical protein